MNKSLFRCMITGMFLVQLQLQAPMPMKFADHNHGQHVPHDDHPKPTPQTCTPEEGSLDWIMSLPENKKKVYFMLEGKKYLDTVFSTIDNAGKGYKAQRVGCKIFMITMSVVSVLLTITYMAKTYYTMPKSNVSK